MDSLALLFSPGNALLWLLTVVHVFICLLLILVVLLQQKRGSDLASAFGAGPSQANVAALSSEDFITKATKYGAFMFMGTSLILARFPPGQGKTEVERMLEQDVKKTSVTASEKPGESAPAGESAAAPATETPAAPAPESSAPATPSESPAPAETPAPAAPTGETSP